MSDKLENDILNLLHTVAGKPSPFDDADSAYDQEDVNEAMKITNQILLHIGYQDKKFSQMTLVDKLLEIDQYICGEEIPTRENSLTNSRMSVSFTKIGNNDIRNDVIAKILDPSPMPILLSPDDKSDLAELIIGALRDSSSDIYKERIFEMETRYTKMGRQLADRSKSLRNAEDEIQYMTEVAMDNERQLEEAKTANQNLEKELENIFAEIYTISEENRELKDEVRSARYILKELVYSDDRQLAEKYLTKSRPRGGSIQPSLNPLINDTISPEGKPPKPSRKANPLPILPKPAFTGKFIK